MKGLSESIVVLAGAVALAGGALAERRQSELVTFIGVILVILGTVGWLSALRRD